MVIIQKSERLSKSDKHIIPVEKGDLKRSKSQLNDIQQPTEILKYRCTLDLVASNQITLGQKKVNLTNVQDLLNKVKDKYISKFDLFSFFFSLEYDESSKGLINFYYKNKIYSMERLAQGQSIAVFYANLAMSLTFSCETWQMFQSSHPEFKDSKLFTIKDLTTIIVYYLDDVLLMTPKLGIYKDILSY